MNKFVGIGRNTREGELRTTESGTSVYRNTIAITNNFKNKEGKYDSEFINYVAYRTTADYLHKYSKKGTLISLEGRIHNGSYDSQDGSKKYYTEIVVENAKVLERTQSTEQATEYETEDNEVSLNDEDIDKFFGKEEPNDLVLPY